MVESTHMIQSNPQPLLRSINDYNNDEDVEAALRESIQYFNGPISKEYRKPQYPDYCRSSLPSSASDPSQRQAVQRELRRLKSLKSFHVLDAEDAQSFPISHNNINNEPLHGRGRINHRCTTGSSGMCLPNHGVPFSLTSAATTSSSSSSSSSAAATTTTTSSSAGHQQQQSESSSVGDHHYCATMSTLNKLVDMATQMLDASTAAISVTDMERQKILASNGFLRGIQEIPRESALGANMVFMLQDTLVVPDLTTDERFQHLDLGDSRFYASAALVTPEGDRIGTVCVIDNKPRPEGLDENQLQFLNHLSSLAMQSLCERRTRLRLEKKLQSATRVVSATVHDLLTPLTAIELALSLLHEDQDFQSKLSQQQRESVKIASNCVGVLGQMCRRMRDQHSSGSKRQINGIDAAGSVAIAAPSSLVQLPDADVGLSADSFQIMYGSGDNGDKGGQPGAGNAADAAEDSSSSMFENNVLAAPRAAVAVRTLVKSIHMAVDAIPKAIPVAISLHESVPQRIVTDDLKVLRCALNLLEHCASIATSGSILLSIKPQYCACGKAMIGFHCENRHGGNCCENSNPASVDQCIRDCCSVARPAESHDLSSLGTKSLLIPTSSRRGMDCCHRHGAFERQCLRNCSEINLYSVAMQMDSLGGDCGLDDPRCEGCEDGDTCEGKSFWFRIPLIEPPSLPHVKACLPPVSGAVSTEENVSIVPNLTTQSAGLEKVQERTPEKANKSKDAGLVLEAQPRKRRALIIEDSIVIRKVIANALSKIGFETETAVNGMEGLHHLQCSTYDVVLCDFLMPVMDGLDCVKQYRDWERIHRPFLHQYIIGMSAHASDQDVEHGLKAGMDCYKPKPLTYKGLKNIVDACEENQQQHLMAKTMDAARHYSKSQVLPSYDGQEQPKMCLIAARDADAFDLARLTEARTGWKSLIVHDGEDALHALKKRNWDAVLLDEKLPLLNGRKTVESFRSWEKENRVNCQTNMFILTASTKSAIPSGANGILPKPMDARKFEEMLIKAEEPSLHIIMR